MTATPHETVDPVENDAFARFVAQHGLSVDASDPRVHAGMIQGVRVRVEVVPTGPESRAVRVALEVGWPGLVIVSRAHTLTSQGQRLTGDPRFDALLHVRGADPNVLGLFDAATRARLIELVRLGVHVVGGEVVLAPWSAVAGAQVGDVLTRMLALAFHVRRMSAAKAVDAIVTIAQDDPIDAVRARYRLLGEESPIIRDALALALTRAVTEPDDAMFARLAAQVGERELARTTRHTIVSRLVEHFPLARCLPVFEPLLDDASLRLMLVQVLVRYLDVTREVEVAYALLQRCVRSVAPADPELLAKLARIVARLGGARGLPLLTVLAEDADPRVFYAALSALMQLEVPAADAYAALSTAARERALLAAPTMFEVPPPQSGELLSLFFATRASWDRAVYISYLRAFAKLGDARWAHLCTTALTMEDEQLQLEAIEALSVIGDGPSTAALRPLTGGFFRAARIKERARAAIDKILSRVGAEPGRLSVAEDSGGGLSVDEDGT